MEEQNFSLRTEEAAFISHRILSHPKGWKFEFIFTTFSPKCKHTIPKLVKHTVFFQESLKKALGNIQCCPRALLPYSEHLQYVVGLLRKRNIYTLAL